MKHDDQLLKAFGSSVRTARANAGLSQESLADVCGLDRTYIGGIERGERNPSLKNIARIARALEMPIFELFEGVESVDSG